MKYLMILSIVTMSFSNVIRKRDLIYLQYFERMYKNRLNEIREDNPKTGVGSDFTSYLKIKTDENGKKIYSAWIRNCGDVILRKKDVHEGIRNGALIIVRFQGRCNPVWWDKKYNN